MALYLPQRWKQQPQGPVAVDWGNPLTRELKLLITGVNPINIASSARLNLITPSAVQTTKGIALYNGTISQALSALPQQTTVLSLVLPKTNAQRSFVETNTGPFISLNMKADGAFELYTIDNGFISRTIVSSAGLAIVDQFACLVGRIGSNSVRLTVNNRNVAFYAPFIPYLFSNSTYSHYATSSGFNLLSAAWARDLSDSEVAQLSENPWQLFKPQRKVIYSPTINYSRPIQDVPNTQNKVGGGAANLIGAGGFATFLPRRWRQQPQGPVAVDWGNPLARGLDFLSDLRNPAAVRYWNSTGQQRSFSIPDSSLEASPPKPIASNVGVGSNLAHDWAKLTDVGVVNAANQTTPFTLFVLTRQTVDTSYGFTGGRGIVGRGLDGDGAGWNVQIQWNHPTSSFNAYSVYTDGGAAAYNVLGAANRLNKIAAVAAVYRPFQDIRLFVDGRNDGTYSNATVGTFRNSTTGHTIGMSGNVPGNFETGGFGDFFLHAAWSRALSDFEIVALSENPWQLFKPRKQIIYVPQTGWTRIP